MVCRILCFWSTSMCLAFTNNYCHNIVLHSGCEGYQYAPKFCIPTFLSPVTDSLHGMLNCSSEYGHSGSLMSLEKSYMSKASKSLELVSSSGRTSRLCSFFASTTGFSHSFDTWEAIQFDNSTQISVFDSLYSICPSVKEYL
jgi:hypothetical protein